VWEKEREQPKIVCEELETIYRLCNVEAERGITVVAVECRAVNGVRRE
jgi:hypothetical protein